MARTNSLANFLTDVANAIRTKKGTETTIAASTFDTEILNLPSGTYQTKNITISANGSQTITPDQGYDAIDEITITTQVPQKQLQTKSYEFTTNQTIELTPDTGYDGFDIVTLTINVPSSQINNQDKTITQNGQYTADSGYTGLGTVIVNVPQTGDVPVKLFKTKEEMNSSTGNIEGDLALVYKNEQQNMTADMEVTAITFPETVTLPAAFTDDAFGILSAVDSSVWFNGNCNLSKTSFGFDSWSESGYIYASYTSEDGITYTRTRLQGDNPIKLPTAVKGDANNWNDNFGYFMQIGERAFEGVYVYKNNNWQLAPTQLDAISDYVYKKSFYGKNGVESGALAQNISNSFNDANADIYSKVQLSYNNMEPRILTDSDKSIDNKIFIIPVKSDGTPLLDTSNVTDMSNMFTSCLNLAIIPKLNTSNVTDMSGIFVNCPNLTTISLLDTSKVTNMSNMFTSCSKLTTIPELNTSNVTDMSFMFYSCSSLTTIPELDTSNVTNMSDMFRGCQNLAIMPELNTNNVTNMSEMFAGCSSLTTIPELDTSNVTDMGQMFQNCSNLTTISLLDTSNVTSMYNMFASCSSLTTIPELNTSNVTSMYNMFAGCSSLTTIPELDTSNVTDMGQMFYNCRNLTTMPELNTSKVTSMAYMFNGCTSLTTIPELDTSNATDMNAMFDDCTNLSDDSLNIIMQMCINATSYTGTKTLKYIGLTSEQATKCTTLSNYSAFTAAGWTTGY